jgi:hypothetical protein
MSFHSKTYVDKIINMSVQNGHTFSVLLTPGGQKFIPVIGPSGSGKRFFIQREVTNYNKRNRDNVYRLHMFDTQNLRSNADLGRLKCVATHDNCDGTKNLVVIHRIDELSTDMMKAVLLLCPIEKATPYLKKRKLSGPMKICITFDHTKFNPAMYFINKLISIKMEVPTQGMRELAFKELWEGQYCNQKHPKIPSDQTITLAVHGLRNYHEVKMEVNLIYTGIISRPAQLGLYIAAQHVQEDYLKTIITIRDGTKHGLFKHPVCQQCNTFFSDKVQLACSTCSMKQSRSISSRKLLDLERVFETYGTHNILDGLSINISTHADMSEIDDMLDNISTLDVLPEHIRDMYSPAIICSSLVQYKTSDTWVPYIPKDNGRLKSRTTSAMHILETQGADFELQNTWKIRETYDYRRTIDPDNILCNNIETKLRSDTTEHVLLFLGPIQFQHLQSPKGKSAFDLLPR